MGIAYIFNEGSEVGLLQRGLFYLAGTGGRGSRAFGRLTSVDARKGSTRSLPPSSALPPISLSRAASGREQNRRGL